MCFSRLVSIVGALTIPWLVVASAPVQAAQDRLALPTTFLSDVVTVALAFSLPAILAGVWLMARRVFEWLGRRGTVVVGAVVVVGLGLAVGVSLRGAGPMDLSALIQATVPVR